MSKKRFSISRKDQKNARKSLDALTKDDNQILGDTIQGGFIERITISDPDKVQPPKNNPSST